MKIKRLKNYNRLLESYNRHFGLALDPLEIFIDNTFARQALANKLNIQDQFKCTLDIPFKLVTSSCVINECEALECLFGGVACILKQFKVLQCRHPYDANKSAAWCIKRRVRSAKNVKLTKNNRCTLFSLASNDETLQLFAREVPGMPIFYVAHCRFNLEEAPDFVAKIMDENSTKVTEISEKESHVIKSLKKKFGLLESVPLKRRTKHKEPNPLSCKKKMQRIPTATRNCTPKKKRKRKRIKNTWAFQQALAVVKAEMLIS